MTKRLLTSLLLLFLLLTLPFSPARPQSAAAAAAKSPSASQSTGAAKSASTAKSAAPKIFSKNGKTWCLRSGKLVKNAWITANGSRYHFGKTGAADIGLVKVGAEYYFFNGKGVMQTGFFTGKMGRRYFSPKDGRMLKGWQAIGKNTYYFDRYGCLVKGLQEIGGKTYYFLSTGVLYKKGWVTSTTGTGNRYYFSPKDGHMYTGVCAIGGKKYLFDSHGVLVRNRKVSYLVTGKDGTINTARSRSISSLTAALQRQVRGYPGSWSIYVKNMSTGESLVIGNQRMYAASSIKLFAMGAAYQRVAAGTLSEGQISGLIPTMIADSNNAAFNDVVRILGGGGVNAWCRSHGYSQTTQVHGLSPAYNNYGLTSGAGSNMTSCVDVGHFLETVYNGTCVNKHYSAKMLSALKLITTDKRLYYRSKLPTGLPGGVICANKTGDVDDYSHDAAIVFSRGADYVISVMAHVPGRGYSSGGYFGAISRTVYNFFN